MKQMAMAGLIAFILWNSIFTSGVQAEKSAVRATWLWDATSLRDDLQGTIAFLEQKNINKVYVQIDRSLSIGVYASFIEAARIAGMEVYALDGAPDWVAPGGSAPLVELMDWLARFQRQHPPSRRFSGIHLDIEPYLYSNWSTQRAVAIESYQKLLVQAKQSAHSMQLPVEADLPFWFDEIPYDNRYGKGNLAEWAIIHTDSITLMAYRDSAQAITEIVKTEIAYGAQYKKPVVIGVETMKSTEGAYVSFYEEGEAFMNMHLQMVSAFYAPFDGYGGLAIHHVGSWKTLRP
ncbi:MAG: amidase [Bacillota bacterium]